MITRSWHMYPLGMLFGLGFDTATEIGVLGISAAEASKGLPFWSILVFPALFAAGMSLIDTTDNILMLGAYGWAFVKPIRKLYYNMTITCVSVVVALVGRRHRGPGTAGRPVSSEGHLLGRSHPAQRTLRHARLFHRGAICFQLGGLDRVLQVAPLRRARTRHLTVIQTPSRPHLS